MNYFMAQEAISSTEIENGPFSRTERLAMFIYLTASEYISMETATEIAKQTIRRRNEEQENTI